MKNEYKITKDLIKSWAGEYPLYGAVNILLFLVWCIAGILGITGLILSTVLGLDRWVTWLYVLITLIALYRLFVWRYVLWAKRYKIYADTYGVTEWIHGGVHRRRNHPDRPHIGQPIPLQQYPKNQRKRQPGDPSYAAQSGFAAVQRRFFRRLLGRMRRKTPFSLPEMKIFGAVISEDFRGKENFLKKVFLPPSPHPFKNS